MNTMWIALLIKPLALLALFVLIVFPIKWAILKLLPDGKLKRLLNFRWEV